jgi:hypothetical protein
MVWIICWSIFSSFTLNTKTILGGIYVTNKFVPIGTLSHGLAARGGWGLGEKIRRTSCAVTCTIILTAHQLLSGFTIGICTLLTVCIIQNIVVYWAFVLALSLGCTPT